MLINRATAAGPAGHFTGAGGLVQSWSLSPAIFLEAVYASSVLRISYCEVRIKIGMSLPLPNAGFSLGELSLWPRDLD